jgi:SAM-dependent methyltransferase
MELSACRRCGHVANTAFDATLVRYDGSYDNSLYCSPTFRRYADRLVAHLVEAHDLHGRTILEVGSGAGDFLAALCGAGDNTGLGFDPSAPPTEPAPGVELVQEYFRPESHRTPFDFLVCRHVLEHLDEPFAFLDGVARSARPGANLYLEVPSAEYNFGPDGLWDCIYPHVSYFSAASLRALVERSGWDVVDEGFAFGGQFRYVEARLRAEQRSTRIDLAADHLALVRTFHERWRASVGRWRRRLALAEGPVVLWGAGAKGVTFANAVDPCVRLHVIDVNARKWGRFLPCTGHEVLAPESLIGRDVQSVLATNPIYQDEIRRQLDDMGVRTTVTGV